jgi:hypothetical protein
MTNSDNFALRRSFRPYMADIVIIGVIGVLFIFGAVRNNNASILWALLFLILVGVVTRFGDLRYRVFWKDNSVERITSNGMQTTIAAKDISHIEYENSDLATKVRLSRPSRRITIYAKNNDHLDVSLKHFSTYDVGRLLNEIHKQRPDLILPVIRA